MAHGIDISWWQWLLIDSAAMLAAVHFLLEFRKFLIRPLEKLSRFARRPALELVLFAFFVGGLVQYGATKGTNGINGVQMPVPPQTMAVPPRIYPTATDCDGFALPEDFAPVTNLCFWGIERYSGSIAIALAWPEEMSFTNRAIDIFGNWRPSSNGWSRLAQVDVAYVNSNAVVEIGDSLFPTNLMDDAAFFRASSQDDTDGDGLTDAEERWTYGTDPAQSDTDGDGMPDGWEATNGFDALSNDSGLDFDGDGLGNLQEYMATTDAFCQDSDGDGLLDSQEAAWIDDLVDIPWFTNLQSETVFQISGQPSRGHFVCELPFTNQIAGCKTDRIIADINGVAYLACSYTTNGISTSTDIGKNLEYDTNSRCPLIAGYWCDLKMRNMLSSQMRAGTALHDGKTFFVVEYSRMGFSSGSGNEVSFQISVAESVPDVVYVKYGSIIDNRTTGGSVSAGAQGGRTDAGHNLPRLVYAYQKPPLGIVSGKTICYHYGCGSDPLDPDTDGDGSTDSEEKNAGTNPSLSDSDYDGLPDAWEVEYRLDAASDEGDNGANGDVDCDGLVNIEELRYGCIPVACDTDCDGLSDYEEVGGMHRSSVSWATLIAPTDLTPLFQDANTSMVSWQLPESIAIQERCVTNITIDVNGLVFFNGAGTSRSRTTTGKQQFTDDHIVCPAAFTVAPYNANLYLTQIEPASSIAVGMANDGTNTNYVIQYEEACPYANRNRNGATNSVSWQLIFPTGKVERLDIVYRNVCGNMTGKDALAGYQAFGGTRSYSFCDNQPGMVFDGLALSIDVGAGTRPDREDSDLDGIDDGVEIAIGTNPTQPDTDGDGMNDGWEFLHPGFDPRVNNAFDGNPGNDAGSDPDEDGIDNREECEYETDPFDADSDGDGVIDGVETAQSSNPNDPEDGGTPFSRVPVEFVFGDPSTSHSEKYRLFVEPVEGNGGQPVSSEWLNENFGVCETKHCFLKRGWKYAVSLEHAGTDPEYSDDPLPDYDYTLSMFSHGSPVVKEDPEHLFQEGGDRGGESFTAQGVVAYLYVLADPEIVAPSVIGVNSDDDNDNGRMDSEDTGEILDDDDLCEVWVTACEPPGLDGNVRIRPIVSDPGIVLWKDRARTQRVSIGEHFPLPGNGMFSMVFYLEGSVHSSAYNGEHITVDVLCDGAMPTARHNFTVIERIAEPITTGRASGHIVNPCGAIAGDDTHTRIEVLPASFPDSLIEWRAISGSVNFTGGNTGRDIVFTAGGEIGDDIMLEVSCGDCPGRKPQFGLKVCEMREVKIYPCVVYDDEYGRPDITSGSISNMLIEVNAIYRQVGLCFSCGVDVSYVNNSVMATSGLGDVNIGSEVRRILEDVDGIEVYFIKGGDGDDEINGSANRQGIIVKYGSSAQTLAHEIGHVCGWHDIYASIGRVKPVVLDNCVNAGWLPSDWNNGTGHMFYDGAVTQRRAIERLIMCGYSASARGDISGGNVYGLSSQTNLQYIYTGGLVAEPRTH